MAKWNRSTGCAVATKKFHNNKQAVTLLIPHKNPMETSVSIEKVESVVRPHLKFLKPGDPLGVEQPLGEVGLDSMASIDLLLDLEDTFGIQIPDEELTENTFANLVEIQKLVESCE